MKIKLTKIQCHTIFFSTVDNFNFKNEIDLIILILIQTIIVDACNKYGR